MVTNSYHLAKMFFVFLNKTLDINLFYSFNYKYQKFLKSSNGFFYPSKKILVCSVITLFFFIKNKLCQTFNYLMKETIINYH